MSGSVGCGWMLGVEEQMERWKEGWMGDGGWVCGQMD